MAEQSAWSSLLALAEATPAGPPEQSSRSPVDPSTAFNALYLPFCHPVTRGSQVLGHLGQSIDGYIATASGDSDFVNDHENIRHLHRLRALHDAVIVGAGTIAADNPRLTTRLVPGPNPVRIVLDPQRRVAPTAQVFTDDAAPTLLVVAESAGGSSRHGQAEVLFIPANNGQFDLTRLVEALAAKHLRKLFVEGGGTTVSRFFDADRLDRLHIAVAPVLTGRGKPGLRLAARETISDCPRPDHRVFAMGQDILFDCDLRSQSEQSSATTLATAAIRRVR